jgi:hypothetical protein
MIKHSSKSMHDNNLVTERVHDFNQQGRHPRFDVSMVLHERN